MVRVRIKDRKPINHRERLKGRKAILKVLARVAGDSQFLARLADNPSEAPPEYYALTHEETAALVSGDIKKIESWLSKLDQRHATWLEAAVDRVGKATTTEAI